MNKEQFLASLRRRLADLPAEETEKSLSFYAESIDDRVEDGMTEEEAVAALGAIDDIAREIEASLPLSAIVRRRAQRERDKGHSALWIVLAVVGFPVWLPLLLTAGVLALTVYVVVWAVIVSLFAVLLALAASGAGLLVYAFGKITALGLSGVLMALGAAAVCFGLAILLEEPARALAKALARLIPRLWRGIKGWFVRKGEVEK